MCVVNGQARPDTKHRAGIIYSPDGAVSYHCFNCEYKTAWQPGWTLGFKMKRLMRQLGFDEAEVQRLGLEILSQADIEKIQTREPEQSWTPDWPDFRLTFPIRPLSDIPKIEYLKSRGLYELANWHETDAKFAMLDQRVILPYTYQNRLVGFTARFVGEKPDSTSKYLRRAPADYVYGLDNQKEQRQYVLVSEGEFDSLITSGLGLGSNSLSARQAQLIEDLNIEPIVIPDRDKASRSLVEQAAERGWNVSFPEWENCKDVNEAAIKYGRLFAINSILQAAEHSPTKIRLLARRYCQ